MVFCVEELQVAAGATLENHSDFNCSCGDIMRCMESQT